jgi:hypothetical protein
MKQKSTAAHGHSCKHIASLYSVKNIHGKNASLIVNFMCAAKNYSPETKSTLFGAPCPAIDGFLNENRIG